MARMLYSRFSAARTATGSGRFICRAKFRRTISNSDLAIANTHVYAKSDPPGPDGVSDSRTGCVFSFGASARRGTEEIHHFQIGRLFAPPEVAENIKPAGAGANSP